MCKEIYQQSGAPGGWSAITDISTRNLRIAGKNEAAGAAAAAVVAVE
jgi:hypothetical protein